MGTHLRIENENSYLMVITNIRKSVNVNIKKMSRIALLSTRNHIDILLLS